MKFEKVDDDLRKPVSKVRGALRNPEWDEIGRMIENGMTVKIENITDLGIRKAMEVRGIKVHVSKRTDAEGNKFFIAWRNDAKK